MTKQRYFSKSDKKYLVTLASFFLRSSFSKKFTGHSQIHVRYHTLSPFKFQLIAALLDTVPAQFMYCIFLLTSHSFKSTYCYWFVFTVCWGTDFLPLFRYFEHVHFCSVSIKTAGFEWSYCTSAEFFHKSIISGSLIAKF